MNKIEEMKALVEKLNQYRDAYYNNAESIVTDHQYDDLCDQLEKMEKETGVILSNSPVHSVGYEVKSKLEKIEHSHLMMSLDKTKDVNILRKFIGDKDSLLMCKMDGLTILLTYEDGELIQAETRGNGVIGEIITHNAKAFENIPMHINQKGHVEIEGEAIITYTDFEKINNLIKHEEDRYKNPRNLASGSVRQLDSKVAAKRHVRFIVWKVPAGMDELPLMSERFEKARELGFDIVPYIRVYKENQNLEEVINLLKEKAAYLSYDIVGEIIGSINEFSSKMNEITDYSKELNSIISYTDLQISDILHYIEFHKFSAAEGYKLCKKLQEICDRRREAKNKIQIINTIKHQSCASVLSGNATKIIEKIVPDKKYTPRVFDELFKKNQSRIRKEKSVKIKI